MPDLFDPFIAQPEHAAKGLSPGNIYWRSRTKTPERKYAIATTHVSTQGNVFGVVLRNNNRCDPTFDKCGNVILSVFQCSWDAVSSIKYIRVWLPCAPRVEAVFGSNGTPVVAEWGGRDYRSAVLYVSTNTYGDISEGYSFSGRLDAVVNPFANELAYRLPYISAWNSRDGTAVDGGFGCVLMSSPSGIELRVLGQSGSGIGAHLLSKKRAVTGGEVTDGFNFGVFSGFRIIYTRKNTLTSANIREALGQMGDVTNYENGNLLLEWGGVHSYYRSSWIKGNIVSDYPIVQCIPDCEGADYSYLPEFTDPSPGVIQNLFYTAIPEYDVSGLISPYYPWTYHNYLRFSECMIP